ncbi:hypothetical protein BDV06DRAFT_156884 [Aspergillus oleicola]
MITHSSTLFSVCRVSWRLDYQHTGVPVLPSLLQRQAESSVIDKCRPIGVSRNEDHLVIYLQPRSAKDACNVRVNPLSVRCVVWPPCLALQLTAHSSSRWGLKIAVNVYVHGLAEEHLEHLVSYFRSRIPKYVHCIYSIEPGIILRLDHAYVVHKNTNQPA